MTVAVCVKCGQQKIGALTACAACKFEPLEPTDKAKSLLLSDHYQGEAALADASAKIRKGIAIDFDQEAVQSMSAQLAPGRAHLPIGCRIVVWVLMGLLVSLVGLLTWLWFQAH